MAAESRYFLGAGTASLALALGIAPVFGLIPSASAAGNTGKGVLKVYAAGGSELPDVTTRNYPKVCRFAVYASGYSGAQLDGSVHYYFTAWPHGTSQLLPGVISLTNGAGHTGVLELPSGMYKPHGMENLEGGQDNFKVFKVTCDPAPTPTPTPTVTPTVTPTDDPTVTPTDDPTDTPTDDPTVTPTDDPTDTPTDDPTVTPTDDPTVTPTDEPTDTPTDDPTDTPTDDPTDVPTDEPTDVPVFTGGGGGTVVVPVANPVTAGAKTLPFTGRNTGELALWGLSSLVAGAGLCLLGRREGKPAR